MVSCWIEHLKWSIVYFIQLVACSSALHYRLAWSGVRIESGDLLDSTVVRSTIGCARICASRTGCVCFGTGPRNGGGPIECYMSNRISPGLEAGAGGRVYELVTESDENISITTRVITTTAIDTTTPLVTTTTAPTITTAPVVMTTASVTAAASPAPCTDPSITHAPHDCGGTPTFSASAAIKLGSNRAIIFTTTDTYIRCSGMNNIVEQGAKYCEGPYALSGDAGLDPGSSRFTAGPPDGGVSYIHSNMADCQYYLFKGDTVYCYQHSDTHTSWMKPCTGSWTVKNIQERFGSGIPSAPDDVIGNFFTTFDFYFLKDNSVYKSTGDINSGSLAAGYPKLIHEEFPNLVCDVTGVTLGLNPGEMYMLVGENVYKEQGGTVYYKGTLCHST